MFITVWIVLLHDSGCLKRCEIGLVFGPWGTLGVYCLGRILNTYLIPLTLCGAQWDHTWNWKYLPIFSVAAIYSIMYKKKCFVWADITLTRMCSPQWDYLVHTWNWSMYPYHEWQPVYMHAVVKQYCGHHTYMYDGETTQFILETEMCPHTICGSHSVNAWIECTSYGQTSHLIPTCMCHVHAVQLT